MHDQLCRTVILLLLLYIILGYKMELLDSIKYPEYYTKVFDSYLNNYNCEAEDSWLESNVVDLVLSFKTNPDIPLRILSIGSGSGKYAVQNVCKRE